MWLPPALLLLSLPGECSWGLGNLELQGQEGAPRAAVPGTRGGGGGVMSGKTRGGFVSALSKSALGSCFEPGMCQTLRTRREKRHRTDR